MRRHRSLVAIPVWLLAAVVCLAGAVSTAEAYVDISFDATTMTEVLGAMSPDVVEVALPGGRTVDVNIDDIKVHGFAPSQGGREKGHVKTSMTVRVPELGLNTAVRPKVILDVIDDRGRKVCRLRFRDVHVPIPVLGNVDISMFLPYIQIPADYLSEAEGARGNVHVRSRLVDVQMGTRILRLRFDVDIVAADNAD